MCCMSRTTGSVRSAHLFQLYLAHRQLHVGERDALLVHEEPPLVCVARSEEWKTETWVAKDRSENDNTPCAIAWTIQASYMCRGRRRCGKGEFPFGDIRCRLSCSRFGRMQPIRERRLAAIVKHWPITRHMPSADACDVNHFHPCWLKTKRTSPACYTRFQALG